MYSWCQSRLIEIGIRHFGENDHGLFRYAVRYAAEKAGGMSRVVAAAALAVAREARIAGNEVLAAEKQEVAAAAIARAAREAAPARLQQLVRAFQ